jgi:hypothetical protein
MEPASIDAFFEHAGMAADDSLIRVVSDMATQSGNVRPGPSGGRIFTDDHAPIEFVTDLIILDAAREGDEP